MAVATGTEWQEARQWLIDAGVIDGRHPVTKPTATLMEFAHCLTDGVFLCMLLNKLQPNSVPHFHPKAKLQFKCVQNINAFLVSLHRDFNVGVDNVFDYGDLTDMSDFGRVVRCLSDLSHSRQAISCGFTPFPSAPADGSYTEEDIYGNLENMMTHRNANAYAAHRPPLPPTGAPELQEEESIYDSIQQTEDEEDIYGSLVSYAGKGKTQEGSGFGGLPEKLGYVVAEVVETEKNYLEALSLLTKHYRDYLIDRLDIETLRIIFINIPDLVSIHQKFYDSLQKQLKSSSKQFSRCFNESVDDFVQYATYCAGLPEAQIKVQELMDKPATNQMLEHCKKSSKQKFYLKELLSVPMQRVLKYPLLLRELIKQAKKCDWHDVLQLEMAAEGIQDVAKCVNEVKRDSERMSITKDVKNGLVEYKGEDIANFGRSLFDGDIKVKQIEDAKSKQSSAKPRYGFLFDRALLVCRPKNEKFIVKTVMKLEDYRVEDMPAPPGKAKFTSGFQLHGCNASAPGNCVIFAKTLPDKQEWLQLVQKAIMNITPPHSDKGNHRFEQFTTDNMTTRCSVCKRLLWGRILQGYQCSLCQQMTVHQTCLADVSGTCASRRASASMSMPTDTPRPPPPRPDRSGGSRTLACRTIRGYTGHPAPPPGQVPLRFGIGEDVNVTSNSGEWWEGTLLKGGGHGVFPSSYVKLKEAVPRRTHVPAPYEETVISGSGLAAAGPPPASSITRLPSINRGPPPPAQRRSILQGYTWFVGKMSRAEAELHLLHSADGVYLIRESEAHPGDYALSIKFEQPKHIRVNQRDGAYYLSLTKTFPSMMGLIEYYQNFSLAASFPGLDTQLLIPFNDTTSVCVANYNFNRRNEEELTIEEHQEVKIFSKETPKAKWWYGYTEMHNAYGLFPSNYVTEFGHQ
ncbi:protein vav-like [Sycon ciliatum]|uniref:protein vav-like n=1 Tax=Sycon ciliatum TaxID=27933 RepID=UPI0020AB3B18|eukprot:scpid16675/ scgid23288/ Guanine nucleotide exchange factor VAV2